MADKYVRETNILLLTTIIMIGGLLGYIAIQNDFAFTGFVVGDPAQELQDYNISVGEEVVFDISQNFDQEAGFYEFRTSDGFSYEKNGSIVTVEGLEQGTWTMKGFAEINDTLRETDDYFLTVEGRRVGTPARDAPGRNNTRQNNTGQGNQKNQSSNQNDTSVTSFSIQPKDVSKVVGEETIINTTVSNDDTGVENVTVQVDNQPISTVTPISSQTDEDGETSFTVESNQAVNESIFFRESRTNTTQTVEISFNSNESRNEESSTNNSNQTNESISTCSDSQCNYNGECVDDGEQRGNLVCQNNHMFTQESFEVVGNSTIFRVDQKGDVWIKDSIRESCGDTPTGEYYEIVDEGKRLFWLNNQGTMCLTGQIYEQEQNVENICDGTGCYKIGQDPSLVVTADGNMHMEGELV